MTVAIGVMCKDGVLVASDSMGSDQNIAMFSRKVHTLPASRLVWTFSGSAYVGEEVAADLEKMNQKGDAAGPLKAFVAPDLAAVRVQLGNYVRGAMGKAYKSVLSAEPLPAGAIHPNFVSNFLLLGYSNDIPWFLEVNHDGQLNWHMDGKFYATGSGGEFATVALALMRHYVTDDMTLDFGKLLAYRTIDTTIGISSSSLGPPVQIAICDAEGARLLLEEEMESIKTQVQRWKAIESESVAQLMTGETDAGDAGEVPTL